MAPTDQKYTSNNAEKYLFIFSRTILNINIAKGTTDPRVEFILPK